MSDHMPDDLSAAGRDLRAYTDQLRSKYAAVKNIQGEWVLLWHAEVVAAAQDHKRFSSNVSRYLQIPNGLDGEEHTQYRRIIEQYLTAEALTPFVPVFKRIAQDLMAHLPRSKAIDAVQEIGALFAVRAQCAWLGWPAELEEPLLQWMTDNHAATRSGEQEQLSKVAQTFDAIIQSVVAPRRAAPEQAPNDVTTKLCRDQINGRLLTEEELVSILRNWTGGDLGSIALCIGVLVAHLAQNPDSGDYLRSASDSDVEAYINEVLRLDNPFISNRRITTCPVRIGEHQLPAGTKVKLNWTSANRDESVFNNNAFQPQEHAADNLVYGTGKHACPGELLSTWQLRIALQALLKNSTTITLAPSLPLEREVAPVGGYHKVPIILG